MKQDKRKSARRPLRYTAWIAQDGQPLHGCVMSDVSDTGARLDVENADTMPDEFVLLLSNRGSAKRKCKVAWRDGNQIGVSFERPQPPEQRNESAAKLLAAAKAKREAVQAEASAETPAEPADKEPAETA